MTTPTKLIPALRQYRSNNCYESGFITGYDYDETNKIVKELESQLTEEIDKNSQIVEVYTLSVFALIASIVAVFMALGV